jgi:hypothetical protein
VAFAGAVAARIFYDSRQEAPQRETFSLDATPTGFAPPTHHAHHAPTMYHASPTYRSPPTYRTASASGMPPTSDVPLASSALKYAFQPGARDRAGRVSNMSTAASEALEKEKERVHPRQLVACSTDMTKIVHSPVGLTCGILQTYELLCWYVWFQHDRSLIFLAFLAIFTSICLWYSLYSRHSSIVIPLLQGFGSVRSDWHRSS